MQQETIQTIVSQEGGASRGSKVEFYPAVASLILVTVAVGFGLPKVFPNKYPDHPESFGANWGIATLSGQWWRLVTYNFVHIAVAHLAGNMVVLWVLGKRLEKEWGHWMMLLAYLSCGLVAGICGAAAHPQSDSYGASTCVAGVAGALCIIYGNRFRSLSWKTRFKFFALLLLAVGFIWEDLSNPRDFDHSAGLSTGIAIAFFFTYFATTPRSRYWTFAGILALLVTACALIQHHYRAAGLIS